jgi:hypothetical protein
VFWLVYSRLFVLGSGRMLFRGVGLYPIMGCVHFRASVMSTSDRKGNFVLVDSNVAKVLF